MKKFATALLSMTAIVAVSSSAFAADKWYPFKVLDMSGDQPKEVEYSPLEKASKPYKLCVVVPHMKDSMLISAES